MQSTALSTILDSGVCQGAYRLTGDDVEPLKPAKDTHRDAARRTRDLWASLGAIVSDVDLMIGKRNEALSIASHKGGMILETAGPVNIGILRAALQHEDAVRPTQQLANESDLGAGIRALWALVRWIENVEASRAIRVQAGDSAIRLFARKGLFGLPDGAKIEDVATKILNAGQAGASVTLTYEPWPDTAPEMRLRPTELLPAAGADATDWVFDDAGVPAAVPRSATMDDATKASALAQRLSSWGEGRPFEVSVLRNGTTKQVVARKGPDDRILITTSNFNSTMHPK